MRFVRVLTQSFVCLLVSIGFARSLWAGDNDLAQEFKSEYLYLTSQKEALLRQKKQAEQNFNQGLAQSKAVVLKLQREVARVTSENDERHEALALLEEEKKSLKKKELSLESTYKRAGKLLVETEQALRFDPTGDKLDIVPPTDLSLKSLGPLFEKADGLLQSSSQQDTFVGTYLDSEDHLVQGELTRIGRVAVFAQDQEGRKLLGPSGSGPLKVLEKAEANQFYIFESLSEAAKIQKQGSWLEKLADLGPVAFLSLMLAMVGGLFTALAKV